MPFSPKIDHLRKVKYNINFSNKPFSPKIDHLRKWNKISIFQISRTLIFFFSRIICIPSPRLLILLVCRTQEENQEIIKKAPSNRKYLTENTIKYMCLLFTWYFCYLIITYSADRSTIFCFCAEYEKTRKFI